MAGYRSSEVREMLGFGAGTLDELRKQDAIAYYIPGAQPHYDREYIHKLAVAWKRYREQLDVPCDAQFFRLSKLQWEYDHPPAGRNVDTHRSYVRAECKKLLADKRVYSAASLAEAIGMTTSTIHRWVQRQKLLTLQIGGTHYLSVRYAQHVIRPFAWDGVAAFADKANLSQCTVLNRLKRGTLEGVLCFDRRWRIRPIDLDIATLALNEEHVRLLTYIEAARRLGVTNNSVAIAARAGRIASTGQGETARVTESEVLVWEERFSHLNEGFDWLEPLVANQGIEHSTVGPKFVIKKLGISPSALTRWCHDGRLLPYFVRSFTTGTNDYRMFVRRYIEGLRRFAGEEPVHKADARQYLELCRAHSKIM